jgi:hypothetical protein
VRGLFIFHVCRTAVFVYLHQEKGATKNRSPDNGAVDWNRTSTALQPPAPQAGASTNSATTAYFLPVTTRYIHHSYRIVDEVHFLPVCF